MVDIYCVILALSGELFLIRHLAEASECKRHVGLTVHLLQKSFADPVINGTVNYEFLFLFLLINWQTPTGYRANGWYIFYEHWTQPSSSLNLEAS